MQGVTKRYIPHPQNKNKFLEVNIMPEGDLYRLITNSQLPKARQFESWVFDEVLPAIRRYGVYAIDEVLNNPDFLIKALTELKESRKNNEALKQEKQSMKQKIEQDKPKVIFADSVSASSDLILVRQLAKLICQNNVDIGEKRLYKWLRENNYLISHKGNDYNTPTQKSMNLGLFKVEESVLTHSDGSSYINKTTKITGKGQQYFINKFMKKKEEQEKQLCLLDL